jgi:2-dehydro-3-deoxyphosphogluconate aldolase/(4S)-4-hydroxy-2-oxoglutarate aldolase
MASDGGDAVHEYPVLTQLLEQRLVVVARRLAPEHAEPVAEALLAAGVRALEITLDDPSAIATITALRARFGEALLIGAGTALYPAQARAALEAGVDFVVSPILVPGVLRLCREAGVLCFPGALTPGEIFAVLDAGAAAVKLFPASAITPGYVRDVIEPLRELHPLFMLTGGLDAARIPAYFAAGVSIAGVGSTILAREDLAAKRYAAIGARAEEVRMAVKQAVR